MCDHLVRERVHVALDRVLTVHAAHEVHNGIFRVNHRSRQTNIRLESGRERKIAARYCIEVIEKFYLLYTIDFIE